MMSDHQRPRCERHEFPGHQEAEGVIREDDQEIVDGGTRSFVGEEYESWRAGNLVGTPEQVAEKVQAYIDLGCTGFYPWCSDYPDTQTLELFARHVMPEFR